MRFIVDEDVPKSAADFLAERGHEMSYVVDVLLPESADHLIARWAHENSASVVTCNVRHFLRLVTRPNYGHAGLLGLPHQAVARGRLEAFIDLIEAEGALAMGAEGPRILIELRESTFLIRR